jgi:O-antigen/teichoic acid export membrane protein
MASSSAANAVLGMGFWAIAAKMFPPEQLGVMTAVLAVIVSVGVVIASGVGDAYTALLPAAGSDRPRLFRRGQRLFVGVALAGGVLAAVATVGWLDQVRGSVGVAVLVVVGVFAWSALTLQNSTLVALGRARWLPATNIAASLCKIALLPTLVVSWGWHTVELSFVAAAMITVIVLRPVIVKLVESGDDLPVAPTGGEITIRRFDRFVAQTALSSALSIGLVNVTPFLVTVYSGPVQGALFALSVSIVQALDFVGAALVVSLVVHASSAPGEAAAMARAILIRVVALAVVGGAALVLIAPPVLERLNAHYDAKSTTAVIAVLASGTVFRCSYMVWAGLQRSRRRMKWPLIFNGVCAVTLLSSMPFLCARYGAVGGGLSLFLAQLVLLAGIGGHLVHSRHRSRLGPAQATPQPEVP